MFATESSYARQLDSIMHLIEGPDWRDPLINTLRHRPLEIPEKGSPGDSEKYDTLRNRVAVLIDEGSVRTTRVKFEGLCFRQVLLNGVS